MQKSLRCLFNWSSWVGSRLNVVHFGLQVWSVGVVYFRRFTSYLAGSSSSWVSLRILILQNYYQKLLPNVENKIWNDFFPEPECMLTNSRLRAFQSQHARQIKSTSTIWSINLVSFLIKKGSQWSSQRELKINLSSVFGACINTAEQWQVVYLNQLRWICNRV